MSQAKTDALPQLLSDYPVVCYPDPVLRRKARMIEEIDDNVRARAELMLEVMYQAKGVGLAGPQVAWSARICALNCTGRDEGVFINPVILKAAGEETEEEGCLSFPGIRSKISRAAYVEVQAYDLSGNELHLEADGLWARGWQHEIDHLDGVLLLDRMSPAARLLHRRQLKELAAEYEELLGRRR